VIDLSQSRLKPYDHQVVGVEALVNNEFFLLADEMGAGKTKQVIDAAQVLVAMELVNQVIVLAPAAVRGVWFDPELGELKKHLWEGAETEVVEYHGKTRRWGTAGAKTRWVITNYEFIRSADRLKPLLKIANKRTLLILDESSFVKSHASKQARAALKLRNRCGRVALLNGTPISHSPLDMYAQGQIMSKSILECEGVTHFKARYALMGGYEVEVKYGQGRGKKVPTQIVGWKNLEDLQQRFAPYVLRRITHDCIDLPPSLDPVALNVPLKPATWKVYKEMRADLISWLSQDTVAVAVQAGNRAMRLAQVCSGFIGGIQEEKDCPNCSLKNDVDAECPYCGGMGTIIVAMKGEVREIGDEKLKATMDWIGRVYDEDPTKKLLLWCRFRPEAERLYHALKSQKPEIELGALWGAQDVAARSRALRLFRS